MELLKQLYEIHSPSHHEGKMIQFIKKHIKSLNQDINVDIDKKNGNIYITKGQSATYPCIVAHLDQVQTKYPNDYKVIMTEDVVLAYSAKHRRQCGLGADDKNGIWVALKCLEKYDVMKVAFFVAEEIGTVGSSQAQMEFFDDCRFVVECDRKGYKDLVTEISGDLCSNEFIKDTNYKKFGYEPHDGGLTDVMTLKELGLHVSCCNMSCGYYAPHTDHETTVIADLQNCLAFVENIIENCTLVYSHEYGTKMFGQGYYCYYSEYDYLYEQVEEIFIDRPDLTFDELCSYFEPHIKTDDIKCAYEELRVYYGFDTTDQEELEDKPNEETPQIFTPKFLRGL